MLAGAGPYVWDSPQPYLRPCVPPIQHQLGGGAVGGWGVRAQGGDAPCTTCGCGAPLARALGGARAPVRAGRGTTCSRCAPAPAPRGRSVRVRRHCVSKKGRVSTLHSGRALGRVKWYATGARAACGARSQHRAARARLCARVAVPCMFGAHTRSRRAVGQCVCGAAYAAGVRAACCDSP